MPPFLRTLSAEQNVLQRYARPLRAGCSAARRLALALLLTLPAPFASAQVELPETNPDQHVVIAADSGSHWTEGSYDVWLLDGNCYINQGLTYARSRQAVLWIQRGGSTGDPPHKVIAYLDGEVSIVYQQGGTQKAEQTATVKLQDKAWFGRFYSAKPLAVRVPNPGGEPRVKPAVYNRAQDAWRTPAGVQTATTPRAAPASIAIPSSPAPAPQPKAAEGAAVRKAQFNTPAGAAPGAEVVQPGTPLTSDVPPAGTRRIRAFGRSAVPVQVQWFPNAAKNEWVGVVTGVNLIVDGLGEFGSIDVAADRLVLWTQGSEQADISGNTVQHEDTPLELYMEGNIVFRQGDRVIYANRMYYDVRRRSGVILQAEILSPAPSYQGLVRLRADVLRQVNQSEFIGQNASVTSSRLGLPSYEFRSGLLTYQDNQQPAINPRTGQPEVNPETGEPVIGHQRLVTSNNNFVYFEQVPVFYWPTIATDLEQPNFYVDNIVYKQDRIFGTQIFTDLNAYQLFGIKNRPLGTKWNISLDYLSKRGPAAGTLFSYDRPEILGIPGRAYGVFDAWGINDHGLDNLGRDRRALVPSQEFRGRILARHRQLLENDFQLSGQLGLVTDRNFLEQYFEPEWDQLPDQATDLELKQFRDNSTWSIYGKGRPTPYFMDTQWLPRLDHYLLGQPLVNDSLTWYEHSNIGYANLNTAKPPSDPTDALKFGLLPYEAQVQGGRYVTRQEIDAPFMLGAVKVTPYVLGELAHWDQALNGDDLNRAYGQVGLRASVPFWSVDPTVESQLFNVHGIAHKIVLDSDISFSDATKRLTELPLYDNIDDNNIEQFRRKYPFDIFGTTPAGKPLRFDERLFALRQGLGSYVASPSTEIADRLAAVRLGARQRWQTKRGPELNRRVVDWITLDTGGVLFPNPSRDNFGTAIGLVNYDFRWFVGDRVTITSDGFFDFFDQGSKYFSFGGFLNKPPRGSLYAGVRVLEGPIHSTVLTSSYSYLMSPKYASTFGTTFALGKQGNIGQNFSITRIGEAFLFTLGFNVDASKGNVGANFAIEPRFLGRARTGLNGSGFVVPPAGAFGLE